MNHGLRLATDPAYRTLRREARELRRHRETTQRIVAASAAVLWDATKGSVAAGPFKGRRYIQVSEGSAWAPKLSGTYELELNPVIGQIIASGATRIIDIGAAEGYDAVGLAWKLPQARMIAFEAVEEAHPLIQELATANAVASRLSVRGFCTPETLAGVLFDDERSVVICDVEGAEAGLLDPQRAIGLRKAHILVELHPWVSDGIGQRLRDRFEPTHSIAEISTSPRTMTDWPAALVTALAPAAALACMDEMRPCPMTWFWICPRQAG